VCPLHCCRPAFARGFHPVLPVAAQMPLRLALAKTSVFCHGASIKQVEVPSDTGLQHTQRTSSHTNGTAARKYAELQEQPPDIYRQ